MPAHLDAIEYHLPERVLSNEQLAAEFPAWSAAKIREKTGISERRIAADGECASDLGVLAARRLFACGACRPDEVDFLILCTQAPDYFLPTTACLMQDRLGLPESCGALDINLGCSGFVYGLGLANGLVETGQARTVLFVTADTYSKFIHPQDRSVRTLFGDAAAATLIRAADEDPGRGGGPRIGPFVFGTDGRGSNNLIVPSGGMRRPLLPPVDRPEGPPDADGRPGPDKLYMNGPEIFNFTLRVVPQAVARLLEKSGTSPAEIDLFVMHQANEYILEHLRKKMAIDRGKFVIAMEKCGNTVSSSIPIALHRAAEDGRLRPGHRVMLVGFGVGYSWGATLIRW